jgi:hypothetical protein
MKASSARVRGGNDRGHATAAVRRGLFAVPGSSRSRWPVWIAMVMALAAASVTAANPDDAADSRAQPATTPNTTADSVAGPTESSAATRPGPEPTTLLDMADERPWPADPPPPRLLAEPFQTPRQLLQLMDIGPSDFDTLVDGQEIRAEDTGVFVKILHRIPQIGLDEIARWQHAAVPWESIEEDPARFRGEFFPLRGRARRLERKELPPDIAALLEFRYYYDVWLETSADQPPVILSARSVPSAWLTRPELDQPAQASGLFLKVGPAERGRAPLLFATARVAWLPDREEPAWGVGPDQVRLASWGMDIGLFDLVRDRNRLPIGAAERESFYALLQAVSRANPAELARAASPLDLPQLLQYPERAHGRLLRAAGSVRRVTRVIVSEPDIRARFGIEHYYQLDVLVSLGDQAVEVRAEDGQLAGPVYRNVFPVTVCMLRIPLEWEQWLGRGDASLPVVIDGVFYKLWSYRNPYVAAFDERQRQLSPMFVAIEPVVTPGGLARVSRGGRIVAGVFLVLLAGIWLVAWLFHRSDRRYANQVLRGRFRDGARPEFPSWKDTP